MKYTNLIFSILLFMSAVLAAQSVEASLDQPYGSLPLRQMEMVFGTENDSFIPGSDDEGKTFSESIVCRFLFEDYARAESRVIMLTLLASSTLSTRFEGTLTEDGRRKQFPEEQNQLALQVQFGREQYWRVQVGFQELNFGTRGRGILTAYQQYRYHEWSSRSINIENLNLHKPNVLSCIGSAGVGNEFPLLPAILGDYLLFQYDLGVLINSASIQNVYSTGSCALTLGTAPVTRSNHPLLSLVLECEYKASYDGFDELESNANIGLNLAVPVSQFLYLTASTVLRIPLTRKRRDFYDPNPEMIIGISVSFLWDKAR